MVAGASLPVSEQPLICQMCGETGTGRRCPHCQELYPRDLEHCAVCSKTLGSYFYLPTAELDCPNCEGEGFFAGPHRSGKRITTCTCCSEVRVCGACGARIQPLVSLPFHATWTRWAVRLLAGLFLIVGFALAAPRLSLKQLLLAGVGLFICYRFWITRHTRLSEAASRRSGETLEKLMQYLGQRMLKPLYSRRFDRE